ncbi:MAG: hypothetical protein FWC36_00735 [Spirochaetes bacterium]|nr:hypothetical protein [Spirochaetota bacterium]
MTRKISLFTALLVCFFAFYPILTHGQENDDTTGDITRSGTLPTGFMNINLGMSMAEVRQELAENPYFDYRGEPDVSMLLTRNQHLIETAGRSFIRKAYFQFYEDRLFIITLVLNPERIDFFTMYTNFEERFDRPIRIDPSGAFWENNEVSLSIERPVTIKYMDRRVLDRLAAERREVEDRSRRIKEEFLNLF